MSTDILIDIYRRDPCRYHASALWKTLKHDDLKIEIKENELIKVYNDKIMFLYCNKDNSLPLDIDKYKVLLLHQSQIGSYDKPTERFFRIQYRDNKIIEYETDYEIKNVDIYTEAKLVADFINNCYEDQSQEEKDIIAWTKNPVFDENLWVWITDKETGEYLGLGIAEYDLIIKEGSLEWIQVLPKHIGKGVGKIIVLELLKRLNKADFVTVSGKSENIAAEKLYRNCGFTGNDIWHVVIK